MKTISLTLILTFISICGFCQIPEKAISIEDKEFNDYFLNKENIPTVKGKILNVPMQHFHKVKINYSIVTPFTQGQIKKSTGIKPNGTFELELDYAFPYQQIWISVGRLFYAEIIVNTDLFIELDSKILRSNNGVKYNGNGVNYYGKDGKLNDYINNHILFKRNKQLEVGKEISKLMMDNNLEHDVFVSKLDSLYAILKEIDAKFIKRNASDYSWILINERQSDYYANLCVKNWGKEMSPELLEKVKLHKPYVMSNKGMGFYNYLYTYFKNKAGKDFKIEVNKLRSYSDLSPQNISILDSITQIEKLRTNSEPYDTANYFSLVQKSRLFFSDTLAVIKTLNTISLLDKEFEQSKSDFLKIKITSKDIKENKIQLPTVLNKTQTEWCKTIINKQYNESIAKLESINKILREAKPFESDNQLGKPIAEMPFGAKMYKVDKLDPKQLLANLKSSNEGKALVIDFWATWCSPCLRELPYSKRLHDATKDLPVEFVYLCTSSNSNLDNWKLKIAEYKLSGTHIFVDKKIEYELMNMFSKRGFPSYVFIDTKGNYKPGAIKRMSLLNKKKLAELIK